MITNAQYTPGPWGYEEADSGTFYWIAQNKLGNKNGDIARVMAERIPIEEAKANARLIAASPDLLFFAGLVSDFFSGDPSGHAKYLKEEADKVIAKAERG